MIDPHAPPDRTGPLGAFGALIRCECGHGIGAHSHAGCTAGVYAACECRLDDGATLAFAIAQAAQHLAQPRSR